MHIGISVIIHCSASLLSHSVNLFKSKSVRIIGQYNAFQWKMHNITRGPVPSNDNIVELYDSDQFYW